MIGYISIADQIYETGNRGIYCVEWEPYFKSAICERHSRKKEGQLQAEARRSLSSLDWNCTGRPELESKLSNIFHASWWDALHGCLITIDLKFSWWIAMEVAGGVNIISNICHGKLQYFRNLSWWSISHGSSKPWGAPLSCQLCQRILLESVQGNV